LADLAAFILESRRTAFAYGALDCLLWPADWIVLNGHPDPAAPYRGRYRSLRGALSFVKAAGGVLQLAEAGAERAELIPIEPADAVSGDVGVGFFEGGATDAGDGEPIGLIRAGDRWAAPCGSRATARRQELALQGPVIGAAEILAAWKV
jgi:hypothetical protein